jgi:hypothetical protein
MDVRHVLCLYRKKTKDKNGAVLGYYAVSSGNFLPMFRDNLKVRQSKFWNPEDGTDRLF